MAERRSTEIDAALLAALRQAAEEQGRSESEVLEEAVIGYLSFLAARGSFMGRPPEGDTADIGRPIEEIYATPSFDPSEWRSRPLHELFGLVRGWQRNRGVGPLSDEEAMRLAVEEQHAMRNERGARR